MCRVSTWMGDRLETHDVVDSLLKQFCQKWDMNPGPHTRTGNLQVPPMNEVRVGIEWRLRPFGRPDIIFYEWPN